MTEYQVQTEAPVVVPLPDDHPAHQAVADSVARVADLFAQGEQFQRDVNAAYLTVLESGGDWAKWCDEMSAWSEAVAKAG